MWIFLNDSFLSIVADERSHSWLRVRARAAGDIQRAFPDAKVEERPANDYRFLALITRSEVAKVISDQVLNIRYGNFKKSVKEQDRHDAYLGVWSTMHQFQRQRLGIAPSRLLADDPEQDYGFDDPELWGERGECPDCGHAPCICGEEDDSPPKKVVRYRRNGAKQWKYVENFSEVGSWIAGRRADADQFTPARADLVAAAVRESFPDCEVEAVPA